VIVKLAGWFGLLTQVFFRMKELLRKLVLSEEIIFPCTLSESAFSGWL